MEAKNSFSQIFSLHIRRRPRKSNCSTACTYNWLHSRWDFALRLANMDLWASRRETLIWGLGWRRLGLIICADLPDCRSIGNKQGTGCIRLLHRVIPCIHPLTSHISSQIRWAGKQRKESSRHPRELQNRLVNFPIPFYRLFSSHDQIRSSELWWL